MGEEESIRIGEIGIRVDVGSDVLGRSVTVCLKFEGEDGWTCCMCGPSFVLVGSLNFVLPSEGGATCDSPANHGFVASHPTHHPTFLQCRHFVSTTENNTSIPQCVALFECDEEGDAQF